MTDIAKSFDPLRLPLQGTRLIEASAGTGKTFTITLLYLRLLLGLSGSADFSRLLSVEALLVVTFTEAATAELRGRIRSNIHDFRIACLRQNTDNPLFKRLLNEISDRKEAAKRLLLAEQRMDEAAIFTIHAFCQRILRLNAFESGVLYEQRLIEDESELRYRACADFWRRHCYRLPHKLAEAVYVKWKNPKALLFSVNPYLQSKVPTAKSLLTTDETLISCHKKIVSRIFRLKKNWQKSVSQIEMILEKSTIDRRKFNRRNQIKWIEKINVWAQEKNFSYQLPTTLKKFSQRFLSECTNPEGIVPEHPLFIAIDNLLKELLKINELMFIRAITEIRETISYEKHRRGELGFDDMLNYLDEALNGENGEELATAIRTRFPVAIIDEFQDTDDKQYRIFRRIWHHQSESALLLIGDPKQAIYAFRGADVFTYMKARNEVDVCYTLDTNWRSSPGMVSSVNTIFSRMDAAFMFREIPFLPVKSADRNANLRFELQGKTQPAMRFFLMDGEGCSVEDYQSFMVRQSAAQIRDWLRAGARGEALLWRGKVSQSVNASDITVLVRTRQEAAMMRDALTFLGIPSVYLSNSDSVFESLEAREILWLLQAIFSPGKESKLRRALASSMLGLTALDIDFLNTNPLSWDAVVEEFISYRDRWKKCGIIAMLHEIITRRKIAENMLASPGGERRLTDILHIGELLQEASLQVESDSALIRWLAQHIANPNANLANQKVRLESNKHLVKIITIHKSKGLEYPLVWLPFIANYRLQDKESYQNHVLFKEKLDLNVSDKNIEFSEAGRLAEDLRLLYVALTRSIWHCSLGLAPLFQHRGKKTGETDFHHSAIGRLIQKGEAKDAAGLRLTLKSLCNEHIALDIPDLPDNTRLELIDSACPTKLAIREMRRKTINNWKVTSYSELRRYDLTIVQDLIPKVDIDDIEAKKVVEQLELTPHQFPHGTRSGIFLHNLLQKLDFTRPVSKDWVLEILRKGGYKSYWQPVFSKWISSILEVPLANSGISLGQLSAKEKLVEMEFYLPVDTLLKVDVLEKLIREHDPLSTMTTPIDFYQVKGILKGFIDLVFCHNDRYYLLDYKSNKLGENSKAYTKEAIITEICSHRYDLQYQIYTLALHRYLRHRIDDYCYETHFGEVIYLFLRGIDGQNPCGGIFSTRPTEALITSMDKLFAKSKQEVE